MSIVEDQIRRLDSLLDRFQITAASLSNAKADTSRASRLRGIVRSLSSASNSRPLLSRQKLRSLLVSTKRQTLELSATSDLGAETDLEWIVAGKATVQVYGNILNTLLQQTIPLSDEIWYWDDVLGSYFRTGLYTAQTAPLRFWRQTKEIYADAKRGYYSNASVPETSRQATHTLSEGWREFYALIQNSVQDRSLVQARNRILSPFALSRADARKKQTGMKRLRETSATAIGLLIDEGLTFRSFEEEEDKEQSGEAEETEQGQKEWRNIVTKSISLLENILRNVGVQDHTISEFEESVFANIEGEEDESTNESGGQSSRPLLLAQKLVGILDHHLPQQERVSANLAREYGRPSRLVRYWIPGTVLLLSASTILQIVASRRAEIQQWIQELGVTIVDFWSNWVVDPIKKLIGTVRHDDSSEIAIMSKDSLKADKASLERMVVDFAVDHPERGTRYSDSQIADIRAKVNEGDLTPVLRAYEHDLKSPFVGAVRGDLIRALLIQIQKTKVDVEVAIGGIDALLKSQELLFGVIGTAPGVLITIMVFRWLSGIFGSRKGLRQGKKQGDTVRLLRNVDRTLCTATPTSNGILSYKDHGLLLCEVSVLRARASNLLPGNVQRDFVEDIGDLLDIRNGIDRQMRIVERIQWAYAKWLR